MAGNWLRLECKGVLLGWTSDLPAQQYAAWIKLLQVVKAFGERGGSIKSAHFSDTLLRKLKISRRAFDEMLAKAVECESIVQCNGYLTVNAWRNYQLDPQAKDRKAAQRAKDVTGVTGTAVTPECHDDRTGRDVDRTGRDGTETTTAAPKPKKARPEADDPHVAAFVTAYDEYFPEPYEWQKADFVQLATWKKSHGGVPPERFVELARVQWDRGRFAQSCSLTIRGVATSWSKLAASAAQLKRKGGDAQEPATGDDHAKGWAHGL